MTDRHPAAAGAPRAGRRRDALRASLTAGALAAIVVLSAACGIEPTGVVDAGAPPSGGVAPILEPEASGGDQFGDVYFIISRRLTAVHRPDLLRPAERQTRDGNADPITLSLRELLTGPSAQELAAGIRSELRVLPSQAPLLVTSPQPNVVQLFLGMVSDDLSPLAALQISCTVRAAAQAVGRPRGLVVQRRQGDGRVVTLPRCPSSPAS